MIWESVSPRTIPFGPFGRRPKHLGPLGPSNIPMGPGCPVQRWVDTAKSGADPRAKKRPWGAHGSRVQHEDHCSSTLFFASASHLEFVEMLVTLTRHSRFR